MIMTFKSFAEYVNNNSGLIYSTTVIESEEKRREKHRLQKNLYRKRIRDSKEYIMFDFILIRKVKFGYKLNLCEVKTNKGNLTPTQKKRAERAGELNVPVLLIHVLAKQLGEKSDQFELKNIEVKVIN